MQKKEMKDGRARLRVCLEIIHFTYTYGVFSFFRISDFEEGVRFGESTVPCSHSDPNFAAPEC